MKKWTLSLIMMILFCPGSFATPPANLDLSYDLDAGTLTARGAHPTQDRFEHYIRRMEVVVNEGKVQKFYFTRQDSANEFNETVMLDIKPGDDIYAEVFCSYGGTKDAMIKIPADQKQQAAPVNLKEIKEKDHKNLMVVP